MSMSDVVQEINLGPCDKCAGDGKFGSEKGGCSPCVGKGYFTPYSLNKTIPWIWKQRAFGRDDDQTTPEREARLIQLLRDFQHYNNHPVSAFSSLKALAAAGKLPPPSQVIKSSAEETIYGLKELTDENVTEHFKSSNPQYHTMAKTHRIYIKAK